MRYNYFVIVSKYLCAWRKGALKMTQKKKWIAVLMAVVCAFSAVSAAFSASAEEQMCTITVELYGSGSVSDGVESVDAPSAFVATYPVGQTVTLTATPGAGRETVYWVNAETDRILSYSDTYSFTAGSDRVLYVDFELSQEAAAQQNTHQVVYLTEGGNILYSATIPIGSTEYFARHIDSISVYVDGKTWTGWDKTPAQVAAETGRVFVHPTYSGAASYTITTIIGGEVSALQGTYGRTTTVVAPLTLNGQAFSYWEVPADEDDPNGADVIASYSNRYEFIAVMPLTLRAVYGKGTGSGIVTRVVGEIHDFENTTITFYVERSVTSDYTVQENGMLFTRDPAIGNLEDQFVLNTGDSSIKKGTSENNKNNGTYYLRNSGWYAVKDDDSGAYYYPALYVRGYVMVRNVATGEITTHYSRIFCADYVNEAFVGVIVDNPHSDPFG